MIILAGEVISPAPTKRILVNADSLTNKYYYRADFSFRALEISQLLKQEISVVLLLFIIILVLLLLAIDDKSFKEQRRRKRQVSGFRGPAIFSLVSSNSRSNRTDKSAQGKDTGRGETFPLLMKRKRNLIQAQQKNFSSEDQSDRHKKMLHAMSKKSKCDIIYLFLPHRRKSS